MIEPDFRRGQLAAEVTHWEQAAYALADLDTAAAPEAWAGLERYLRTKIRDRLSALVAALQMEAAQVRHQMEAGGDPAVVRRRLLRLRHRYLQAETVLDYTTSHGDERLPGQRSPSRALAAILPPLLRAHPSITCSRFRYIEMDRGTGLQQSPIGHRRRPQASPYS